MGGRAGPNRGPAGGPSPGSRRTWRSGRPRGMWAVTSGAEGGVGFPRPEPRWVDPVGPWPTQASRFPAAAAAFDLARRSVAGGVAALRCGWTNESITVKVRYCGRGTYHWSEEWAPFRLGAPCVGAQLMHRSPSRRVWRSTHVSSLGFRASEPTPRTPTPTTSRGSGRGPFL